MIEEYRCIAVNITNDEVVITPGRIQHIKDHHFGHYVIVKPFIQAALDAPDYILEDKSHNTGLILKAIEEDALHFQLVLRLHTMADTLGFKNSILSAWEIRDKEYMRLARTKNPL